MKKTLFVCFILFFALPTVFAQEGQTTNGVNIRSGPGMEFPIIGSMASGASFVFEARNEAGDWALIHTNSDRGWITTAYVSGDISDLPVSDEQLGSEVEAIMARLRNTPVIPGATGRAREIYAQGLAMGNDPTRFAVVGDCQSVNPFFLTDFDRGTYDLGEYGHLQGAIDHFAGSFNRDSSSVSGGFTIASVLDPTWAGSQCQSGESPQACEYRLWKPSFVIVSLEMWRGSPAEVYETHLRNVLDFWIEQGVVPIVATKANNNEGDWSVNAAIAKVAWEYDLPLWNFLMATQPLPEYGLTDGFHLTPGATDFSDPENLEKGWPQRNLTALQALDAVWRGVQ